MKEVIIGKLGNQPFPITDELVSRRHAVLRVDDYGRITITDTNSSNGTFVRLSNGIYKRIVGTCELNDKCILRFGPNLVKSVHELLGTNVKQPNQPVEVDITALRYMMMHYQENKMKIEQKKSSNNLMRMMMIPISSVVVAGVGVLMNQMGDQVSLFVKILSPLCSLIVCAIFFIYLDRRSKALIRQSTQLDYNHRRNYCCPKCHFSFVGKIYDNILAEGCCPNPKCKARFYESTPQEF